jgi:hypothetical protein
MSGKIVQGSRKNVQCPVDELLSLYTCVREPFDDLKSSQLP